MGKTFKDEREHLKSKRDKYTRHRRTYVEQEFELTNRRQPKRQKKLFDDDYLEDQE